MKDLAQKRYSRAVKLSLVVVCGDIEILINESEWFCYTYIAMCTYVRFNSCFGQLYVETVNEKLVNNFSLIGMKRN